MEGEAGKALLLASHAARFYRNSWRPSWRAQAGWSTDGKLACVPAKEFGYLLKGHKWQTGSLWVVFTDMLSLASEVLCKNLGSILNSRALGFCLS